MSSIIESLGVYLPPTEVTTAEVLAGCRSEIAFPLERLTGIHTRRVAGVSEFSIDLAAKAVERCLRNSRHGPGDVELLVCCNISRCDGPGFEFTFEPSTAVRLRQRFGFEHALAFDVTNACAGMFTGILVADAALSTGRIRRAMVVSGEYISHLIRTAQLEIDGTMDPRLACLTVGDAGAALILEPAPDPGLGFLDLEVYTLGDYSSYCVAKATEREHGGAIMLTDSLRIAAVSIKEGVQHAAEVQQRNGWSPDGFDHLIMHQTSEMTLNDTARAINEHFGRPICRADNTLSNLGQRGNTATTSHFVALMDHILDGRIRSRQRLVFGISGSGLTIGTGIYALDDLPERMLRAERAGSVARPPAPARDAPGGAAAPERRERPPRVRVESVARLEGSRPAADTLAAAREAAEAGLARSARGRQEVGLLIHSGVYRTDFLSEPAVAALLAGELGINSRADAGGERTLAFDVLNGALGTLNACWVASQMIRAGRCRVALLTASEVENNAARNRPGRRGLLETASALVLESSGAETGFGAFVFKAAASGAGSFRSFTRNAEGTTLLAFEPGAEEPGRELDLVRAAVGELLEVEGVGAGAVDVLVPLYPGVPAAELAAATGIPAERCLDASRHGDPFTSSLAFAFDRLRESGRAGPGALALLVGSASGRQVGCATYHC